MGTVVLALSLQRDHLMSRGPVTDEVAHLLVRRTEPGRSAYTADPAQRPITPLHAPVILFHDIVFGPATAMNHLQAQRLTSGARGGVVAVGRHLRGALPDHLLRVGEEACGRVPLTGHAEHRLHQIPVRIDRAVERAPYALDRHRRLICVPLSARFAAPLTPSLRGQQRRDQRLPLPHRLVSEDKAPLQDHLGQVPRAEIVAEPPKHHQEDAVGGHPEIVERGTGPLVDAACAGRTADVLAERMREGGLAGRGPGIG